jgi:hypothetical protein
MEPLAKKWRLKQRQSLCPCNQDGIFCPVILRGAGDLLMVDVSPEAQGLLLVCHHNDLVGITTVVRPL